MKRNRSIVAGSPRPAPRARKSLPPRRAASGAAVMQPAVTEALGRALFEEWAASGYAGLRLERVAARAGVGKAALYRRWASKAEMASECLGAAGLTITDVPDQGSLAADLRAALLAIRRALRHPLIRRIVPDLHAELMRSPELEAAVRPFQAARRARGVAMIERAIARGELPASLDMELVADLVAAPLYWRLTVTGGTADAAYLDRLVVVLIAAIRACAAPK
jgi:AcrR family transcriptional regulator